MAAGGLFGAILAAPARARQAGLLAASGLGAVTLGRGLLWEFSSVHLMPAAAALVAAALAWWRQRLGLALLAVVYLAWIAQRGW